MLSNHYKVQKDLRLIDVRGRVSILGWYGRCRCRRLVLLELTNLGMKVVDDVVSVRECYSTVLHLLKLL
jgi:cell fate regulator YaaT (PSP1 superfamily)